MSVAIYSTTSWKHLKKFCGDCDMKNDCSFAKAGAESGCPDYQRAVAEWKKKQYEKQIKRRPRRRK